MKSATVRDLRYHFPEIEARLREGDVIQITKRKRVIARLAPVKPRPSRTYPDFRAIQREVFGSKRLKSTGAELVSAARGKY
ncbi:MAG TPA: hypothetical protein VMX16_08755 [Terriglobia bacterium]|nr:hypothetical protein [Terriglobia bacterium]